jgi:microcystin degradation protein MlrC
MTFTVAIGGLAHETNQYVRRPTPLEDFRISRGDEITALTGARTYISGMLDAAQEAGARVVGTLHAVANPSGVIEADAYQTLKSELLRRLQDALPIDAVVLDLHGAGVAEQTDDVEGDLGAAVRDLIGPDVALVVTHDLHGHITDREAAAVDAMFGVHHYPHDDMYERGVEAVAAIPELLAGRWRPTIHVERLPLLLPATTTYHGVGAEILDLCQNLEKQPGVIDVTFMHGFPYTDNRLVGAHVIATTNDDAALAAQIGREAAQAVWSARDRFIVEHPPPPEAISRALALAGAPIVINETSDNPGGGAPADHPPPPPPPPGGPPPPHGTHLLRALLDAHPAGAVFCGIKDPQVVEAARLAGVGSTIDVEIGGKTDDLHGAPIRCRGYVKTLTDGEIVIEAAMGRGFRMNVGPTALLIVDGVEVIVFSRAVQTIDRTPLLLHGIDPTQRKIIALKSSNHFRSGFDALAAAIITTDPPGLTTVRLENLPRTRTPRPVFPLDPGAVYPPAETPV